MEQRGIATVSLSSALSITEAAGAPRAVFLDFPLGRTAGLPFDAAMQRRVAAQALRLAAEAERPGAVALLDERWPGGDGWKATAMRGGDSRLPRHETPQYQSEADAAAANAACPSCVWLDESG